MLALARYNERKFDAAVESLEEALRLSPRFLKLFCCLDQYTKNTRNSRPPFRPIPNWLEICRGTAAGGPLLLRLCGCSRKTGGRHSKKSGKLTVVALSLEPGNAEVLEALGSHYMAAKKGWTKR
jgi:hypothetical protein